MKAPQKTANRATTCPRAPRLGIYSRESHTWKRHTHPVHGSTIYSGQDMEAASACAGRGRDTDVVHTQRTITQPRKRKKHRTVNRSGWGGYIQTRASVTLNNRDNCLENMRGKCAKGKTCHDIFGNKSNNKCTLSIEEKISIGMKIQKEI